jgi:hypothetical protein
MANRNSPLNPAHTLAHERNQLLAWGMQAFGFTSPGAPVFSVRLHIANVFGQLRPILHNPAHSLPKPWQRFDHLLVENFRGKKGMIPTSDRTRSGFSVPSSTRIWS